ncbi:MAG: ABA4-like family protein [Caldimonas sp.]
MTPDRAFGLAGNLAMLGWLLLIASLFAPVAWRARLRLIAGRFVPALLSAGYVAALLAWWPDARGQGGFSSLAQVAALFSVPGLLLAGWVHYLAFDLLVGRWQVDDSGVAGAAAWWLLPCLVLTFVFGPAGWLLYLLTRTAARRRALSRPDAAS